MSKYSSDKKMQKLFEGFRNTINEAPTPPPGLDDIGTTVDKDGSSAKDLSPEELSNNPDLKDMGTTVDKDGSSAPPDDLKDMGTVVDKEGSSADMVQRKAKAFDQVEGALKQLLKKIQDAGL